MRIVLFELLHLFLTFFVDPTLTWKVSVLVNSCQEILIQIQALLSYHSKSGWEAEEQESKANHPIKKEITSNT